MTCGAHFGLMMVSPSCVSRAKVQFPDGLLEKELFYMLFGFKYTCRKNVMVTLEKKKAWKYEYLNLV